MTERAAQLKLAVDVGSDPITGSLTGENGDPKDFSGWIELVAAIEAARYNGGTGVPGLAESTQLEKRLGWFPGAKTDPVG